MLSYYASAQKAATPPAFGTITIPQKTSTPPMLGLPAPSSSALSSKSAFPLSLPSSQNLFIENKGQWDAEARFLARLRGMTVWITDKGLVYDVYQQDEGGQTKAQETSSDELSSLIPSPPSLLHGHVVKMNFLGRKPSSRAKGIDKQAPYFNYFLGNDRTKWASNVPSFAETRIEGLYEGISARVYFDSGQVRYDMILEPGADASQIALEFEGADDVFTNRHGELVLKTSVGELLHGKLYAYQVKNGRRVQISCRFTTKGTQQVAFALGEYDPALPLVIDPLVWGTYFGGSGNDNLQQIAFDPLGNIVATGIAANATLPAATAGAYDNSFNGGQDMFVAKFSADGRNLLYMSYLGGTANDIATALAVAPNGNIIVGGYTLSANFPTQDAFDATYNGLNDMTVTSLNGTGTNLVYSTYLGTIGGDEVSGIAVDNSGIIYVSGTSDGGGFPTTLNSYQTAAGGNNDVVLLKINPAISGVGSLLYSTYLGGINSETSSGIGIDAAGMIYFWGNADDPGLVCTPNAFDATFSNNDAFVGKLNPASGGVTDMLYLSYFGGTGLDRDVTDSVDENGQIYIVGLVPNDFSFSNVIFQNPSF
jgi:hypothetical protein